MIKNVLALVLMLFYLVSFGQESQSIIAAKWSDGKYPWFKNKNSYSNSTKPEFEQSEEVELSFKKNDNGEVIEIKLNSTKYTSDSRGNAKFVRYFRENGDGGRCLFFTSDECIEVYSLGPDEWELNGRYSASIGKAGSKKGFSSFMSYLKKTKSKVEDEIALFEKNKAENTIVGKVDQIEKVEPVVITKDGKPLKSGDQFSLGFITTFKDGKVIKTKNIGGLQDIKEFKYRIFYPIKRIEYTYNIGTDLNDSIAPYCDYLQDEKAKISVTTTDYFSKDLAYTDLPIDNCDLDPSDEGVFFRTVGEKYDDLFIIPNKGSKWGSHSFSKHEKFGFFLQRSEIEKDFDYDKLVETGGFIIGEKNKEYFFLNFDGSLKKDLAYDEIKWLGEISDYLFYKDSKLVKVKRNGKYGILDKNLNEILPLEYDIIEYAENDRIIITKNSKSALMNSLTMEMPSDFYDEIVLSGNREQYRVKLNNKYGYIDKDGKFKLELKYDFLGTYANGYATAVLGDRNFYLNTAFSVKLDLGYKQISGFSYKSVTKNGKQRDLIYAEIIDENGEAKIIDDSGYTLTDEDFESSDMPSTSTSSNSSSSSSSSSSSNTKTSTKCTILNDLKPDQVSKYNDVRLVFDNNLIVSKSLSRGQSMEVDCDDVIVHAGELGSTNSKKVRKLFETKGKCGQTIKLSEYW
jgi:hypothetical protein